MLSLLSVYWDTCSNTAEWIWLKFCTGSSVCHRFISENWNNVKLNWICVKMFPGKCWKSVWIILLTPWSKTLHLAYWWWLFKGPACGAKNVPLEDIVSVLHYWPTCIQGDHLSGKPGNVREFDSCQGNVRDFTENQGNVMEKILSGKSCLNCICVHTGI